MTTRLGCDDGHGTDGSRKANAEMQNTGMGFDDKRYTLVDRGEMDGSMIMGEPEGQV